MRSKIKPLKPMNPPVLTGGRKGSQEHDEQVTFFEFVKLNRVHSRNIELREALELCYSVPNGANLPKKKYLKFNPKTGKQEWKTWSPEAKWLIAEGMTEGILDINLDVPISGVVDYPSKIQIPMFEFGIHWITKNDYFYCVCALRIEMKVKYANGKKNYLSPEQKRKKELLEKAGYKVEVCYSAKEAIKAVVDYLPFPESDYQGLKEYLR